MLCILGLSEHFFHVEGVAAAVTILALGWGGVRLVYTAVDTIQNTSKIVRHIWTNSLPHMEAAIRKMAYKMGIDYDEPDPPPLL